MFPRWLGVLLVDFGKEIHGFISIPSAIAEISMVLYLLVIGVKTVKPDERPASVAARATD